VDPRRVMKEVTDGQVRQLFGPPKKD
jgi:hypothetical protein